MEQAESKIGNPLKQVHHVAISDIGVTRSENQDNYGFVEKEKYKFYFVADGMGGARGGATASKTLVDFLKEKISALKEVLPADIRSTVKAANLVINEKGNNNRDLYGMGTTLVGLIFTDTRLMAVNVGDSRAYRIRQGHIKQLTTDHTLVGELVRSGAITEDQMENHPVSHMLTRSLGPTEDTEVDCDFYPEDPQPGDIYLLCSDGLYNFVPDYEMAKIVSSHLPEDAAKNLVDLVNSREGNDNITVLIVTVGMDFPAQEAQPDPVETLKLDHEEVAETLREYSPRSSHVGKFIAGICAVLLAGVIWWFSSSDKIPVKVVTTKNVAKVEPSEVQEVVKTRSNEVIPDPLLDNQREQILTRKADLEKLMAKYEKSLAAIINPKADLDLEIADSRQAIINLGNEFQKINSELDIATGKLTVWVGRKKKLVAGSEVNMAVEVAPFSEEVLTAQKEFDGATRKYLNTAEDLRYQPHNEELQAKVKALVTERKIALERLKNVVKNIIEAEIDEAEHRIAELSTRRSELRASQEEMAKDLEVFESIKTAPANIKKAKNELESRLEVVKSEYSQLLDMLDTIAK